MAFVAFGMAELLLLLASTYSSPTHDLVSLMRAEDYFKSRNISLDAAEMVKLAEKEPADGKAQIQQLLAIRWLGEHPDQAKKTAGARTALEQIAAGKKAQDRSGFARLYARQALARLDRTPLPAAATAPPGGLRGDAFAWFPADANVVAGMELRPPGATLRTAGDPIGQMLARMMPAREREEMYRTAEALGNVRLDRVTIGLTVSDGGNSAEVVVRLSGAGDRKRLAGFLEKSLPGATLKQTKGPKGEPITLIDSGRKGIPAFALVGDSDLVVVPEANRPHAEVLARVLDVRAGKQKGLPEGKLARLTQEAPRHARAVVAYELSEKAVAKAFRHIEPVPAAPRDLLVYVTKGDPADATKAGKLSVAFRGRMRDAEQAKAFADSAAKLKQEGLKELDSAPPREIPPAVVKAMRDTLASLKVEATRSSVKAELTVANESALLDALKTLMEERRAPPAPPEKRPLPSPR